MDAERKTDEMPAEMPLQIRQARSEDIDHVIAFGEIDDISHITLGSITIATMLKLIDRHRLPDPGKREMAATHA